MSGPVRLGVAIAAALAIAGCTRGNPSVAAGITMLRYGFMNGSPAALTTGTLRLRDGCIWLEDATGSASGVLWPSSAHWGSMDAPLRVWVGDAFAADGDRVSMGGGEYNDQMNFVESLVGPIRAECQTQRYWLVSTLERLGP